MAAKLAGVATLMGRNVRDMQWSAMRFEHITALRARLVESGKAPSTVNATLCALRGVARAAWNLEQMTAEQFQRIESVRSVKGSRLPSGRALSSGEVAALLDACWRDSTAAGARDAAVIALLIGAGLRRSEAAQLRLEDYDPERSTLKILGKGDKERLTYLTGGSAQAMADWLQMRGSQPGALLCPVNKSGTLDLRLMSPQAIYDALLKRAREASVRSFTPHDLRRTFVSDLLDAGADISAVQQLVGHANIATTQRYDRRGEQAKQKAAQMVRVPYRTRTRY